MSGIHQSLGQRALRGGARGTFDEENERYRDGLRPEVKAYRSPEANLQARLLHVANEHNTTPAEIIRRYGGKDGSPEDRIHRAVSEAERTTGTGDEYITTGIPYDAHIGGTGTHLSKPLDLSSLGLKNQDTSSTLYALKRLKRQMQERIEDDKHASEYEAGRTESERPVELVRSCKTAGPGWDYCDPLKEGECPPTEVLKGTAYENVFSAEVGVPPNNKAVRCVPADLIRIGGDDKRSEASLNRRLSNAIETIYKESKNITRLAGWRTQAPCDAIPGQALRAHPGTCDSMFFKDDGRTPNRCINAKTADTMVGDDEKDTKTAIQAALADPSKGRCFDNPNEYSVTLQRQLFRIKRLRQALRVAAEAGMRVTNFVNRFDRLAENNKDHYYHTVTTASATDEKKPFQWGHVSSYILDDSKGNIEDLDAIRRAADYECKDAIREVRRHIAAGGEDEDEKQDSEQLAQELAKLLTGGGGHASAAGAEQDPCTAQGSNCDKRLLRALKILHRLYEAEQEFLKDYKRWYNSYKGMLDNIDKDVRCRQHNEDPDMCKNLLETCADQGYSCDDKSSKDELDQQCKKVGTEHVSMENFNRTWTVEKFDDNGNPIGFKWLVDGNLRSMRNDMEAAQLRQCAAHSRTTVHDMERHREVFRDKQGHIMDELRRHYPSSVRLAYRAMEKDAMERDRGGAPQSAPLTVETLKDAIRDILQEKDKKTPGSVFGQVTSDDLTRSPEPSATVRLRFPDVFQDMYKDVASEIIAAVQNNYGVSSGVNGKKVEKPLDALRESLAGGGGAADEKKETEADKVQKAARALGKNPPAGEIEIDLAKPVFTTNASLREGVEHLAKKIIDETFPINDSAADDAAKETNKANKAKRELFNKHLTVTVTNVQKLPAAELQKELAHANNVYSNVGESLQRTLQREYTQACDKSPAAGAKVCEKQAAKAAKSGFASLPGVASEEGKKFRSEYCKNLKSEALCNTQDACTWDPSVAMPDGSTGKCNANVIEPLFVDVD